MAARNSRARPEDRASANAEKKLESRVPPHSDEAEDAVLAGMLLRNDIIPEIADLLKEKDFYLPANRVLYSAYASLYSENKPVDEVTVFDWLVAHGAAEEAGGAIRISELTNAVVSAANALHWARIVRERAMQRELINASAEILSNSYDSLRDVPTLIEEAERSILAIAESSGEDTSHNLSDLVSECIETTYERSKGRGRNGIATGYEQLDRMTSGFQSGDLIILAARPSMGKTAFALNLALRSAMKAGTATAIFSLEMSHSLLAERLMSIRSRISLSKIRQGTLSPQEWNLYSEAGEVLRHAPICIDDTPSLNPMSLRAKCRRIKARHGLDLVIVDYLQLMHSERNDSRELEISDISRNLKALAREFKVPVIALSQLNRKIEERSDKRPLLSDLRESGAIEQDADIIMFIHREDAYKKNSEAKTGKAEIIIGKHRNGPTGTVELMYKPEYTAFDEISTCC